MANGTQFLRVVALFSNSETVLSGSHITRNAQGDRRVRLTTASSWTRGCIASRRPCIPGNADGNSSPCDPLRVGSHDPSNAYGLDWLLSAVRTSDAADYRF